MPSVHNILSVSMVFSTILVPAHAQFGVPKKGTGFEELNDQAQKLNEVGVDALGGIGGLGDLGFGTAGGDYGKALEDMMDKLTPAQKKELEQYGENANEAVNNIMNMDPSELSAKMNDVMATMDDEEELKKAIGEPDVLVSVCYGLIILVEIISIFYDILNFYMCWENCVRTTDLLNYKD
mmetsp:Transcript_11590/g.25393  ORF Transcript_11590/g.25393 Transcript_11590/m.25393 type:complete len:180 (-) Transcript_11590:547-1086(-)